MPHAAQPGAAGDPRRRDSAAPASPSASQHAACSPAREYAATARSRPGLWPRVRANTSPALSMSVSLTPADSTSPSESGARGRRTRRALVAGAPAGSWTVSCICAVPVAGGLHAQAHDSGAGVERALDRRPLVGLDVLAHDRVPHHGQLAVAAGGERLGQPLRAAARRHRDRIALGHRQGGPHAVDPVELVGPDVGEQGELVVGTGRVERATDRSPPARRCAAPTRAAARSIGGGGIQGIDEPQRRIRVAELAAVDGVGVAVGEEVQAGARADLEQADRAPVAVGQPQQAREQDRGATRLVGLDGAVQPLRAPGRSAPP